MPALEIGVRVGCRLTICRVTEHNSATSRRDSTCVQIGFPVFANAVELEAELNQMPVEVCNGAFARHAAKHWLQQVLGALP